MEGIVLEAVDILIKMTSSMSMFQENGLCWYFLEVTFEGVFLCYNTYGYFHKSFYKNLKTFV